MIGFTRPSVQTELDRFYKTLSGTTNFDPVSKSAFTQSRRKLNPNVFKELNNGQVNYFNQNAPFKRSWKGKRIIAIDSSSVNLPHTKDVEDCFGSVRSRQEKVIAGLASFAYDVCNDLVIDAMLAPKKSGEQDLAVDHLHQLNPQTDILVFDRGYPAQWLMGLLDLLGFKYCFRLSTSWKNATEAVKDKRDVGWTMRRENKSSWGKLKTYGLPRELENLRLLSIPLDSGEQELLVTNLSDSQKYTYRDMKELYQLRWPVEESFKTFKKVLNIEYFSGRTSIAVKQDFHARVLMQNLASMVRTQGIDFAKKPPVNSHKYKKKANKTQAIAKLKDFLIDLFYRGSIKTIIDNLIRVIEKSMDIIRPNRSFSRPKDTSRRRHKVKTSKGV